MKRVVVGLIVGAAAISVQAQSAPEASKTYAQTLVDREVAKHPEIAGLAMQVTPSGASAANIYKNGKLLSTKSSPEDLKAISTGQSRTAVTGNGSGFEVELPLHDASSRAVGALSVSFPYHAGDDTHALQAKAEIIRNELRRRISHAKNLLEAAQFDARVPLDTYAQKILDESLDKHPDIIIMAMHATIPNTHDNVIVASNIGRIGKKADEDDMRVVNTEKPNLEVAETGDRFEAELVFENAAHQNIGAIGIVYAYKAGDDKMALKAKAERVRDELAQRIPSAAKLFDPVGTNTTANR